MTEYYGLDMKKVNAAVKIKLALSRMDGKYARLQEDFMRLRNTMSHEEFNEYSKRVN